MKKSEVIKHSAIIQIEHQSISLVGQQVFNVLLAHAFRNLKTQDRHQISLKEILKYVPSARNIKRLKTIFDKELFVKVKYNIFNKDKEQEWGIFALLPEVALKEGKGICEYAFTPKMIELVSNPTMYAKISLLIQKQYSGSKYGWFLYELCFDYKKVGKTPPMSVLELRQYFGIASDLYKQYKDFNKRVLKPAIIELNKQTDLTVKPEVFKSGRRITHIQFHISEKDGFKSSLPMSLSELTPQLEQPESEALPKQKRAKTKEQAKESMGKTPSGQADSELVRELQKAGVSAAGIKETIKTYSSEQIQEALQVYREARKKKKGVEHPDGFMSDALKKGWQSKATRDKRERQEENEKLRREVEAVEFARKRQEEENRRRKEERQKDKENYKNSSDEEKFEYISHILKTEYAERYQTLTPESLNVLKNEIYRLFSKFDSFLLLRTHSHMALMRIEREQEPYENAE